MLSTSTRRVFFAQLLYTNIPAVGRLNPDLLFSGTVSQVVFAKPCTVCSLVQCSNCCSPKPGLSFLGYCVPTVVHQTPDRFSRLLYVSCCSPRSILLLSATGCSSLKPGSSFLCMPAVARQKLKRFYLLFFLDVYHVLANVAM